jgi:hypothetical protein
LIHFTLSDDRSGMGRHLAALAVALVLALACDAALQSPATGAGDPAADAGGDDGDPSLFGDGYPGWDWYVPAVLPDALPPPTFPCLDAGADASACPLPHSVCVSETWLEYFDNGACIDGTCSFTPKLHSCLLCADGGCVVIHSTAPVPP